MSSREMNRTFGRCCTCSAAASGAAAERAQARSREDVRLVACRGGCLRPGGTLTAAPMTILVPFHGSYVMVGRWPGEPWKVEVVCLIGAMVFRDGRRCPDPAQLRRL